MSAERFPDDRINAFVDEEAAPAEREELFRASRGDEALRRRIAVAHELKALVRHAYDVSPARPARRPAFAARRIAAAVLAAALLSAAAFEWHDARSSRPEPSAAAPHAMPGLVIQVADADPAKWKLAVEQAAQVASYSEGRVFDVVVIAYGPGLPMLRRASPIASGIGRSQRRGIRFVACGNTMETEHVAAHELLPGVAVAKAGATLEILALQKAGYAYVRI